MDISVLLSCVCLPLIAWLGGDIHVDARNTILDGQSVAQYPALYQRPRENDLSQELFDGLPHERQKRAYYNIAKTINRGIQITKSLLYGTKRVNPDETIKQIYVRKGGIAKLKKDFYRFKPTEIKRFESSNGGIGKVGKVADRILIYKTRGDDGLPQLEIVKAKDIRERETTGKKLSDLPRKVIKYND